MTRRRSPIRIPAVLVAALVLLLPLCGAPARAGQEAEVWVAFGDSLTASRMWTWTDLLAKETGNTVINSGRDQRTTTRGLKYLEHDVLRHHPDRVLVMFGVNDQRIPNGAKPGTHAVPPEAYARNLDTIVTRIQASGAKVVLMTNRPLIQGPGAPEANYYLDRHGDGGALYLEPGKVKGSIRLYNDIVRAKAREHGTDLVDIWQAVVDRAGSDADADVLKVGLERPGAMMDGVHLGPGGARFYADTIVKAMPFR